MSRKTFRNVVIHDDLPGVTDDLFYHWSDIHGSNHVNRVIVNASVVVQLLGFHHLHIPAWAATFMHDLARYHDEVCEEHGPRAASERFREFEGLFVTHGLQPSAFKAVKDAVKWHSISREAPDHHPNFPLIALVKDADALDRWRLKGGPDPSFFRYGVTHELLDFSRMLFERTDSEEPVPMNVIREQARAILENYR